MDCAGAKAFIGQLAGIMQAIRRSPVVTVAAVSGYCLGGAFELALACDLRVVTTTAAFGLPEIKVGVPSVIDAAPLPGFVGLNKAREMILTGDTYRLDQLPPDSIANVITEPGLLAGATASLLERTAMHTRTVTAAQRRLFSLWLNNPLDAAVEVACTAGRSPGWPDIRLSHHRDYLPPRATPRDHHGRRHDGHGSHLTGSGMRYIAVSVRSVMSVFGTNRPFLPCSR